MKEVRNNWPAGIKRTRQRECVLSILEKSDKPLSATDICSKMEEDGDSAAWYELNRFKHKHYAVCMNCHKIIAMDNCPMESFVPKLAEDDFHVMGHNLEVFGFCKDCSKK